jgi:hypothetical protein
MRAADVCQLVDSYSKDFFKFGRDLATFSETDFKVLWQVRLPKNHIGTTLCVLFRMHHDAVYSFNGHENEYSFCPLDFDSMDSP